MTESVKIKPHPTELEIADFLAGKLTPMKKIAVEEHTALCDDCLMAIVSAHESVRAIESGMDHDNTKGNNMKKINVYLVGAVIAFILSFLVSRFFLQLLTATIILGIKWVVDSRTNKMLIMIYEAWKKGGEKEASKILETLNAGSKNRF